jgi:hypothetical protein
MILYLFAALAMATPPTACDPSKDTAPATAGGFCLDEDGYLEIADLRKQVDALKVEVAAKSDEVEAFEEWKRRQESILTWTVDSMTAAHERGIDLIVAECQADLEVARQAKRRTFVERHGFVLGVGAGIVGTVALTAATLEVYGAILDTNR